MEGPHLVSFKLVEDNRGCFGKTYMNEYFDTKESFYSKSRRGVLRGMHYQVATEKVVCAMGGDVLDVCLDLETGEVREFLLYEGLGVYVPLGWAHGFQAITDATLIYYASREYAPGEDYGVRWDSFGYEWPMEPILSERDRDHPLFLGAGYL